MINQLRVPSHSGDDPLHLDQCINIVPDYNRSFWTENPIHLQENVIRIAPKKIHVSVITSLKKQTKCLEKKRQKHLLILVKTKEMVRMDQVIRSWIRRESLAPNKTIKTRNNKLKL